MNHPTNFKYDYSVGEISGSAIGTFATESLNQSLPLKQKDTASESK